MKQAVAYYRVSTRRQGKSGLGLKAQKSAIHEYARNNTFVLVKEFKEIQSGGNNRRFVIKEVIDFCLHHNATLLIAKQDRLARNVAFVATLMESDVNFIAVDDPNADELMRHIKAAFDQYERKKKSHRAKETAQELKKKGIKLGTNGRKLSRYYKRQRGIQDRKVGPLLRKLHRHGMTIRAITNELSRRGIKNLRGGRNWHISTVHGIILRTKIL